MNDFVSDIDTSDWSFPCQCCGKPLTSEMVEDDGTCPECGQSAAEDFED